MNLAVSGIDRNYPPRPVLQQAIGKTTGRGSNIEADATGYRDLSVRQRFFQLQPAPAHILQIAFKKAHLRLNIDGRSRLLYLLLVDENLPRQDQRLTSFA